MALSALSLSVTSGIQGRRFQATINGLTTGKVEVLNDGSPGFSTVNGKVMSHGLPYPVSTVVLREREPGVGQGYRDTRIDITALTAGQLYNQALGMIGAGRALKRYRVGGERQSDGSIVYSVFAEDDLGATAKAGAGQMLKKYPNFPQTTIMAPRQAGDYLTYGSGTFTLVDDSSFDDGRKVIKVTPNLNVEGRVCSLLKSPEDWRNGHVSVWLKISPFNTANWQTLSLRVYSSGSPASPPANYSHMSGIFSDFVAGGGFTKNGKHTKELSVQGTGADMSAVTWTAVHVRGQNVANDILISDIQFVPDQLQRAVIAFRKDDAWRSDSLRNFFISRGIPFHEAPGAIAGPNGYNGDGYNTPPVSNPSRETLDNINAWRATGKLQVMPQALLTEDAQPNQLAYRQEFEGYQKYHRDHNWTDDAADVTYYNTSGIAVPYVRQEMLRAGARSIGRFLNGRNNVDPPFATTETFPFRDETAVQWINLAAPGLHPGGGITTITDSIMRSIDRAIAIKGFVGIAGHNDMYEQSAEWDAIVAVADRWAANPGQFDVVLVKDVLDPFLAQYGGRTYPAPNYG